MNDRKILAEMKKAPVDEVVKLMKYESSHVITSSLFSDIDKICIKRNDPILSYKLAKYVPGVDFEAHQQIVINSRSAVLMNAFATYVNGADKEKIERAINENCTLLEQIAMNLH